MDNWRTPPEVWNKLDAEFNSDVDAAADHSNALCKTHLKDALGPSWGHGKTVYCNPPYGRMLEPFVRRCAHEAVWNTVVALIPVRTRAAWWHECVIQRAAEIRFIRKRVKFLRPDGVQAAYTLACDSALIVWRPGINGARVTSWTQVA